ncbi:preprotein translocase subunit YajC [Actinophytocola sp. KF-1]
MELLPLLLMFGLLGVMMYFMSRRQRRAQEQQQALQNSLAVGDRVMTTSGLYGTVTDTDNEQTVSIEIAPGVETEWLRAAVREKVGPVEETDDVEALEDAEIEVEPVDPETNEPPAAKDAELESGKQK